MNLSDLFSQQSDKVDSLGIYYKKEIDYTKTLRREKEVEWIRALRQVRGQYDPEVLVKLHPNASKVYPKYTRYKIKQWKAGLQNIILPDNDKNWGISPTPKPNVTKDDLDKIITQLKASGVEPSIENVEVTIQNLSKGMCKEMELEMEDQLADVNYDYIVKETINSGLKYGTGVIKGIQTRKMKVNDIIVENGVYQQISNEKYVPYFENTRIWDYYPDMGTMQRETMEFEWERMILTKHQLRDLGKRKGFYLDVIKHYISEHPKGDSKYEQWEVDLHTMDSEAFKDIRTNKYEIYTRHGYVDVDDLVAVGILTPDEVVSMSESSIMCDIWLLGNRVIKISKSEYIEPLYHIFYFEKDETSIFGRGLPEILRDTQQTICSGVRMALDNGAICAAPQVEVNIELLDPGEDPDDFRPRRVWKRWGRGIDAQIAAVRPLEFNSHVTELLQIVDKAEKIGEMEISFALFPQEQMETPTRQSLGEASMRASSRVVTVKEIVKQWDDCSNSIIHSLYQWNMAYNDKKHIKGDYQVEAKGVTTLISKEILSQRVAYFTQTLTDQEKAYIKPGKFLLQKAKILDLDPTEWIKTDDEVAKDQAAQQDQEMQDLIKQKLQAEIVTEQAKAKHMDVKSSSVGVHDDLGVIDTLKSDKNAK